MFICSHLGALLHSASLVSFVNAMHMQLFTHGSGHAINLTYTCVYAGDIFAFVVESIEVDNIYINK